MSRSDFSFQRIRRHFKADILAAFAVSLVALPLGLGVAMASGVPPIAGLWAAIVGGLITTLFRGGAVSINGPAAGLIVVILAGMESLKDDLPGSGFKYVLAATVLAGSFQVILGLLRMGKFANMVPSSVIHGMLAAIGVIIASKQVPYALGVDAQPQSTLGTIMDIPQNFLELHPVILLITLLSMAILLIHPRIKNKLIRAIPAPIWVLLIALPLVFAFNFFEEHSLEMFNQSLAMGPGFLVDVPDNVMQSIIFPDFSKINTLEFWGLVLTLTIIASIQTLVVAKAVDKLDPEKRQTDLDRDLFGVGVGNVVAGMIGALPLIAVIVRSSVNIQNGAKTRWSNFYHGLFLLIFILLIPGFIQMIPLAALAALLIFTGYKLASPKVFVDTWRKGWEQFLVLLTTLFATLYEGLLLGIATGILLSFIIQLFRSGLSLGEWIRIIFKPKILKKEQAHSKDLYLRIEGVLNFLNILRLRKELRAIPEDKQLILDLSTCILIDYTVLEYLHLSAEKYDLKAQALHIIGLDVHQSSSRHPFALQVLKVKRPPKLTRRQKELQNVALANDAQFLPEVSWDIFRYKKFNYFKTRPIEYKINSTYGRYPELGVKWEFCDLIFNEGVLTAREVYHCSILLIHLPFDIPEFVLEKEGFFDRITQRLHLQEDLNFNEFKHFSDQFLLRGGDETAIRAFFEPALIEFLDQGELYHIESTGNALVLFREMRFVSPNELQRMLAYAQALVGVMGGGLRS